MKRPTWRTVSLMHLKFVVEETAAMPGHWCAYRLRDGSHFRTFDTWRDAIDYALGRVAELLATEQEHSC